MSDYYYSFKEKGFFWQPDTESDNYPDDLIPLTDEYYQRADAGPGGWKIYRAQERRPGTG